MSIGTVARGALGSLLDLARRAWRALRPIVHRLIGPLVKEALSLFSRLRPKKPTAEGAPRSPPSTSAPSVSSPASPPSARPAAPSTPSTASAPSSPATGPASAAIRSPLAAAPAGDTAALAQRWQRFARRLAARMETTAPG